MLTNNDSDPSQAMPAMLDRNSNIELLRIITAIGVFVLHYNNPYGGKALTISGGVQSACLLALEALFCNAVDLFVLITGYFNCQKKAVSLFKGIELLIQVILFQFMFYFLGLIKGSYSFSARHLFSKFIPQNWFVILYVVMWTISPYMNIVIEQMNDKLGAMIICFLVLFSIYPTAVDLTAELIGIDTTGLSSIGMYGAELGYTIVNFMLMYFIGAYLRIKQTALNPILNAVLYMLCCGIILWMGKFEYDKGIMIDAIAWEYCNPLVICSAALAFLFFRDNLKIHSRRINTLAKASFTCYLVHGMFYKYIGIEKYVNAGVLLMLLHIFVTGIIVYAVSFVAWLIYHFASRPIMTFLKKQMHKINLEEYLYQNT